MKKVLAFDIDQTLNVAKTPIPDEIADLLVKMSKQGLLLPLRRNMKTEAGRSSLQNECVEKIRFPCRH